MKRWTVPPQVRPDGEGVVVAVAEGDEPGVPVASTSRASVTTAPSTHPPETEPITSPSPLTAMAAPGSRGPEPSRSTTRARATCLPWARQRSRSRRRSLIGRSPPPAPRATRASGPRPARRRAAAPPPCPARSARSPGSAFSGFTHTRRWATRCRRRTCSPSTAGSPRSQPSERITTTAPRARPRTPHVSLKVRSPSPRRVPPDQSSTTPATASSAASGSRDRSSRVMRVHRVPSVNTSTGARPDHGDVGEADQRPRVGLHRAGHVAQQHDPPGPVARPAGGRCAAARRPCAGRAAWWRRGRAGRAGGGTGGGDASGAAAPTSRRSAIRRWASSSSAARARARSPWRAAPRGRSSAA